MRGRCHNPNLDGYKNYGARGITVDPRWGDFVAFRDWSLSHGFADNLTINRIDNNGPYSPENCEWVTWTDQMHNTRQNRIITAWGETKILIDWARDPRCSVQRQTIMDRLRRGWTEESAISLPAT
jgi:hypothetical protein